jgi:hypothetical protein
VENLTFLYVPHKLIDMTQKIKSKFPKSETLNKKRHEDFQNVDIKELLQKIKSIELNRIKIFSRTLKNNELYALAIKFPTIREDLLNKVVTILKYRCNKGIIEFMWQNFINDYDNKYIIDFFQQSKEQIKKIKIKGVLNNIIDNLFQNNPLDWLFNYFNKTQSPFMQNLSSINISDESKLAQTLMFKLFTLPDKNNFKREETEELLKIFKNCTLAEFKKITENYLEIFNVDEFNTSLMLFIIERLGKPTENQLMGWQDISKNAYNKAKNWYLTRELKDFYDSIGDTTGEAKRRFQYWLKYRNYLEDAVHKKQNSQLFMIFKNVAVIEFGELGNAAYVYSREDFNENFSIYMRENNSVNKSILKNQFLSLHRIIHFGNWETATDYRIRELIELEGG